MFDRSRIREGMTVFSSEGEKLGKVLTCDQSTFIIEKGFFFPKDYVARYDDVADVRGDDIQLSLTRDAFRGHEERMGDIEGRQRQREPGFTGAGGFSADGEASEEDVRRHVQGGEDPGTIGARRGDPDPDLDR